MAASRNAQPPPYTPLGVLTFYNAAAESVANTTAVEVTAVPMSPVVAYGETGAPISPAPSAPPPFDAPESRAAAPRAAVAVPVSAVAPPVVASGGAQALAILTQTYVALQQQPSITPAAASDLIVKSVAEAAQRLGVSEQQFDTLTALYVSLQQRRMGAAAAAGKQPEPSAPPRADIAPNARGAAGAGAAAAVPASLPPLDAKEALASLPKLEAAYDAAQRKLSMTDPTLITAALELARALYWSNPTAGSKTHARAVALAKDTFDDAIGRLDLVDDESEYQRVVAAMQRLRAFLQSLA